MLENSWIFDAAEENEVLDSPVIERYLKNHKNEALVWAKEANLTQQVLTPIQAVSLQAILRLSNNKVRNMRSCLNNLNMNIWPSERKTRKAKDPLVSHVQADAVETGMIMMLKKKSDEEFSSCPFIRVKDLVKYLKDVIANDSDGFIHEGPFGDKWWLLFAGDKGGQHMKFHVEILNSVNVGSVDNVHIYCMFEATDSYENMSKVWIKYRSQVQDMQDTSFSLNGKGVVVFFGGDWSFLDESVGHGGSSSSFPSCIDKVELSHLKTHNEKPHTPENCPVEIRTTRDYHENLAKNYLDDRNHGDRHKNGKYHCSVVEEMLFPLTDLSRLVPAVLHINLGITVLIYDELVGECRKRDEVDVEAVHRAEKVKLDEDLAEASIELSEVESRMKETANNIALLTNRLRRVECVADEDIDGNLKLSKEAGYTKKSRRQRTQKSSVVRCKDNCIITVHDVDVTTVDCDECESHFHCICEGFSPVEEMRSELEYYKCLTCSKIDVTAVYEANISWLINEEDELMELIVQKQAACDELKGKFETKMGLKEKSLSEKLEAIHVVRQAYHSNAIVGNHCMLILRNHSTLTDVLKDDPETKAGFDALFSCLHEIMILAGAKRFLAESEIVRVRELSVSFAVLYHNVFPDRSITRKVHELIFNVPRFVEQWKTIGLFSEQEGESKHNAVNQQLRVLACMREPSQRLRLVLEREELRGFADKRMMAKPARLCRSCSTPHTRYFVRSTRDGTKHCPNCESSFFQ